MGISAKSKRIRRMVAELLGSTKGSIRVDAQQVSDLPDEIDTVLDEEDTAALELTEISHYTSRRRERVQV